MGNPDNGTPKHVVEKLIETVKNLKTHRYSVSRGIEGLRNAQKNHINLFEYPIFFYAVCIIIFITGNVDAYFVTLAYWFFYLRLAHSVYHIFFNHLVVAGGFPVRALIFVPALLILIWMWIRLIGML